MSRKITRSKDPLKDEWGTPNLLYSLFDDMFHFDLDACATAENAKHPCYITKAVDSLSVSWVFYIVNQGNPTGHNYSVWMNPPYSDPGKWVAYARKAVTQHNRRASLYEPGLIVACLVSAGIETRWFIKNCLQPSQDGAMVPKPDVGIYFLTPRVQYVRPPAAVSDGKDSGPQFPSMVVVFGLPQPVVRWKNWKEA